MPRCFRVAALLVALGGALSVPARAADPEAGQAIFKQQCGICHSPLQGKNMVGPSLFGVIGRTSGTVEGFHYSAANKAAAITWTPRFSINI